MPGHRDPLLIVGQVMLVVLVVAAVIILPLVLRHRRRSDHLDIHEEAERRGFRAISIRFDWRGWFGFFGGPFDGDLRPRGSRIYRVECESEDDRRTGCVLIGPRRRYESTEQLTWRWMDGNRNDWSSNSP